ncbi:hypothetical protein [Thermococcus sp. JCM 11816]|uniref:hypothetical protein n=1 Tax=Thermococcus sp. (strain JCM 11816 / KS-1) TaxID=1295125 RepID=UPI0006D22507
MDGNDNILHITPVSSVMFRDKNGNIKLVRDDIELALVTVEAYRFSIGNPMKRRRIVTLIGAGIAAAGLGYST